MSDQGTRKLLVIDFTDDMWAQEFLLAAMRLARSGKLTVHDAVFVSRDAQGHSAVRETTDLTPGRGALGGAVWGLLIGTLLGGPIGGLVGGAAAGGGGALLGKLIDTGIKDDKIKELRETVKPGTTALALQVSNVSAADLEREIERFPGASVVESDLPEDALHAARTALDEAPPAAVPDDPNIRIGLDDPPAPAAPPTLSTDDPTADRPSGPPRSSTDPTGPPTPA